MGKADFVQDAEQNFKSLCSINVIRNSGDRPRESPNSVGVG